MSRTYIKLESSLRPRHPVVTRKYTDE